MKNSSNLWSIVAIAAVIIAIIAVMSYATAPRSKYSQPTLVGLAQALAAKGVTMYGAAWCTHCQAEKARFGAAFQYVPYVECPDDQKPCLDKGVQGYPTWITKDSAKYEGEQGIEKLAEIAGYDLNATGTPSAAR